MPQRSPNMEMKTNEDGVILTIISCNCQIIPEEHYHLDNLTVVPWKILIDSIKNSPKMENPNATM